METLRRFIIALLGLCVSTAVSCLVMIKGWGVQPKSWAWILGFSFIGHFAAQCIIEIAKSDKK